MSTKYVITLAEQLELSCLAMRLKAPNLTGIEQKGEACVRMQLYAIVCKKGAELM